MRLQTFQGPWNALYTAYSSTAFLCAGDTTAVVVVSYTAMSSFLLLYVLRVPFLLRFASTMYAC